jgi:LmbE family N-acetylglucosaminyl deacetylase
MWFLLVLESLFGICLDIFLGFFFFFGFGLIFLKIGPLVYFFLRKEFFANLSVKVRPAPLTLPPPGSHILFFAPHPDDDIAGCAGFIQRALQHGCMVKVVFITCGDGVGKIDYPKYRLTGPRPAHFEKIALRRIEEARKALRTIGVADSDILFLGFPDGCLQNLWWDNWDDCKPCTSPYTRNSSVIYRDAYKPDTLHSGNQLAELIKNIIADFGPQCIVYPHFYDFHADHFSTNNFVKYAIARTEINATELTYLVHRETWPLPLGKHRKMRLYPPNSLLNCRIQWQSLELTEEELARKEQSLAAHKTQLASRINRMYLLSFVRENELFGIYKDSDFENIGLYEDTPHIAMKPFAFTLIVNPFGVNLRCLLHPSANIGDVAIVAQDGAITIMVQMLRAPRRRYRYTVHLVFIAEDRMARHAIISMRYKRLLLEKKHGGSISELPPGTTLSLAHNHFSISMPLSNLPPFEKMLFNVVSFHGREIIDRTGMRLLQFKNQGPCGQEQTGPEGRHRTESLQPNPLL